MKSFLKLIEAVSFGAGVLAIIAYLSANVFVMRSETVQQFILDYGFQTIMFLAIAVKIMAFLAEQLDTDSCEKLARIGIVLVTGSGLFFVGSGFAITFVAPQHGIVFLCCLFGISAFILVVGVAFLLKEHRLTKLRSI